MRVPSGSAVVLCFVSPDDREIRSKPLCDTEAERLDSGDKEVAHFLTTSLSVGVCKQFSFGHDTIGEREPMLETNVTLLHRG